MRFLVICIFEAMIFIEANELLINTWNVCPNILYQSYYKPFELQSFVGSARPSCPSFAP